MKKYIGVKVIEAEPMKQGDFAREKYGENKLGTDDNLDGYKVKYSDNYVSWSPKDVFEEAYIEFPLDSALKVDEVKEFIKGTF